MPKVKKFIDRKKAVTFHLAHRSQRDPLIADENAPQRVLVPVNVPVPPGKDKQPELTKEQRKVEQQKYGIYFDDDYNYLQHLKDTREVTLLMQPKVTHKRKEKPKKENTNSETLEPVKLTLPSSVFASEVEEDIGLLNRAAPQGLCLDLDHEVVAALDEDFDFDDPENQLEDNFIDLAMQEGSDEEEDDSYEESMSDGGRSDEASVSDPDSDDDAVVRNGRMPSWDSNDDTKSRFSQYSMSSSIIRRNEGLSLLDKRFEKMYAEYDDTEIGALDFQEIQGFMSDTDPRLLQAAEEFENSQRNQNMDRDEELVRINRLRLQEIEEESQEELVTVEVKPKLTWDCETILTTLSNKHNHPAVIEEPKMPKKININAKTGIPRETLGQETKLTLRSLAKFNAIHAAATDDDDDNETNADTVLSTLSVLSIRPKDETPEDKKERKRLIREYRKERRIEKKANKQAFKDEKKRQEKIMLNNRINIQGRKL